ncbi:hypothetical protein MBOU_15910 [Mycobacterium bourgelatii]|uniref:Uncharacterized protein n=1 Tax=Mycobacterium bourgelatii TaxID=1273442 RepID=A0A7I9YLN6_MYCBU|nr:hypothetical protein MBOU_15910 [Mycobacterium bourgelatii]
MDRPEIAGGEALAGLLRPGGAGSNTAADHVSVLAQALATCRRDGGRTPIIATTPTSRRCWCAATPPGPPTTSPTPAAPRRGVLLRLPVDWRVQDAVDTLNIGQCWYPAIDTDGGIREGAWVAEATNLVNLSSWRRGPG